MDLGEVRAKNWERTGRASDVARQLSFAGIAAVWVMRDGAGRLVDGLMVPLVMFILALALDFVQYFWASVAWPYWARAKEKAGHRTGLVAPRWFNWPTNVCFYGKMGVLLAGCIALLRYASSSIL